MQLQRIARGAELEDLTGMMVNREGHFSVICLFTVHREHCHRILRIVLD